MSMTEREIDKPGELPSFLGHEKPALRRYRTKPVVAEAIRIGPFTLVLDSTMPADEIDFVDPADGSLVGKITGLKIPALVVRAKYEEV